MCVALTTLGNHQFSRLSPPHPPRGGSEEWPPVRRRLTMVGRLCLQVSFHAGWTIHGGARVGSKASFNLLGGYIEWDMDTTGAQTGVNNNFYVTSPDQDLFPASPHSSSGY